MLIKRTDLQEPVTIEFAGVFGETPADYRFDRRAGISGFVCEIDDEIVVRRLLSIEPRIYVVIEGEAPAGPAPALVKPAKAVKAGAALDMTAARAHYKQVVGKNPSPRWDAAELLRRINQHISGETDAEADSGAAPDPEADDAPDGDGVPEGDDDTPDED